MQIVITYPYTKFVDHENRSRQRVGRNRFEKPSQFMGGTTMASLHVLQVRYFVEKKMLFLCQHLVTLLADLEF